MIPQIFYNTLNLNKDVKKQILQEAKSKSFKWWVDILPKNQGRRERIEMDWDTILEKLSPSSHFVIIQRSFKDIVHNLHYGEIGFSTNDNYYLFIYIELENFKTLVKKFNLSEL